MQLAKILLLAITFTFLNLSNICNAETPDPNQWVVTVSGQTATHYLYIPDLNAARSAYKNNKNITIFSIWTLSILNDGTSRKSQCNYDITANNKRMRIIQTIVYKKNGEISNIAPNSSPEWESILPNTVGDANHDLVTRWITKP